MLILAPARAKRLIVIGSKRPFPKLDYPGQITNLRLKDILEKILTYQFPTMLAVG